jgi:hypothetical protein
MKYLIILLTGLLIVLVTSAGCVETDKPSGTTTPVPTALTPAPTPAVNPALAPAVNPAISSGVNPSSPPGQVTGGNASAPEPVTTITPGSSPAALNLKENYLFGNSTTWKSEATVYRVWINDTYRWFSPGDNQYFTRVAPSGKKYLFIFLSIVCRGTDRAPLPQQDNVYVLYDTAVISHDPAHALPTKNSDSSPKVIRIGEIEFSKKRLDTEYVEDYGYSHGLRLGYVNPGDSNAVDGYIIYEVPVSLTPENAFVSIVLPQTDTAIWKLG